MRAAGLVDALDKVVRQTSGFGLSAAPLTWPGDGGLVTWLRGVVRVASVLIAVGTVASCEPPRRVRRLDSLTTPR